MNIPEPKFEFRHHTPVQIRFNDIDMFGHLNNSVYLQFADLAKMRYFMQFMDGKFDPMRLGLVVANINCDFYHPAYVQEKLESTHSGCVYCQLLARDGATYCQRRRPSEMHLHHHHGGASDPRTATSVPVTDQWRTDLSTFEGRQL